MKSKIIPFLFILLLAIGMVSAFDMPWVLRGKVTINNQPLEGMQIQITGNNEIVNVDTSLDGRFQYDITQFNNRVNTGDKICVIACSESAQCKQCIAKDNSGGKWVEINVTDPNAKFIWIGGAVVIVGSLVIFLKKKWSKGFTKIIQFWGKKEPKRAKKIVDNTMNKMK